MIRCDVWVYHSIPRRDNTNGMELDIVVDAYTVKRT